MRDPSILGDKIPTHTLYVSVENNERRRSYSYWLTLSSIKRLIFKRGQGRSIMIRIQRSRSVMSSVYRLLSTTSSRVLLVRLKSSSSSSNVPVTSGASGAASAGQSRGLSFIDSSI